MPDVSDSLGAFDRDKLPTPEDTPTADGQTSPDAIFDDRWKDAFHGLAYLGAASRTFEWLGHKFVIRTLTDDEELAIAQIIKDWDGTVAHQRAYMTAIAAMCTETIDGQGLPSPIGEGPGYGWVLDRFNFVKARWFKYTIDKVYEQYLVLESEVRAVLEEMGKAFGQADPTPGLSESSDSLSAGDF
jgi:hypothetical protein